MCSWEDIKKVKDWTKENYAKFRNKISNKDGSKTRFIFGMNAKEGVIAFFVLLLFGFFTSWVIVQLGGVSNNPIVWATGMLVVISRVFIVWGLFSVVKLRSAEPDMRGAMISLVLADVFVFLYHNPMKNYFGDIPKPNLGEMFNIVPSAILAVLIPLLVVTGIIWYKRAGKTEMEEIYGRRNRVRWGSTLISSFIVAFFMILVTSFFPGESSVFVFRIRDAFILYLLILIITSSYNVGVKLWETSKNITSKNLSAEDIPNGKRVYFVGDYSRLDIRTDVKKILYGYNYEEKSLFYEVAVGKNKYLVYAGHKFNKLESAYNQKVFQGAKLEVWGISIKIRKDGKDLDYIVPYRINVLEYPQLK